MVVCAWCNFDMTTGRSCTVDALHVGGRRFELGRFGSEPGEYRSERRQCGDCGVERGGLHHPGCDLQSCPRCLGQLLSCGCRFGEDGPDDDWGDGDDGDGDDGWDVAPEPFAIDVNGCPLERAWLDGVEVVIRHDDVPESDITTVHGLRCTTALRTFIDLAPGVGAADLQSMVTDALARGLFTEGEAWERLGRPDLTSNVGADLLRHVLRTLE